VLVRDFVSGGDKEEGEAGDMKIQPAKRCPRFGYPTMIEMQGASSDWRARIPHRWEQLPGFAALLGLLALSGDVRADADEAKPAVSQAPDATKPAAAESTVEQSVQQATSIVAPLLDEALRYDGRGAFGCMVVNPPTFLAEDEALELIRRELRAAGLDVKERVILDNLKAWIDEGMIVEETTNEDGETVTSMRFPQTDEERAIKLAPRAFMFDLADADRSIYVEYLAREDYAKWEGISLSSVDRYDFPQLARKVSAAWSEWPSDKRTVFGVFFDPLAHVDQIRTKPIFRPGMTDKQMAREKHLFEKRRQQTGAGDDAKALAKEKLRKQVRHFVEFLRQEGLVGKGE
jgi:hypothetical protein